MFAFAGTHTAAGGRPMRSMTMPPVARAIESIRASAAMPSSAT